MLLLHMTDVRQVFLEFGIIFLCIGWIGLLGLNYAMMCSACTRTPPCNYISLLLAVIFMSLITACITAMLRTQIVLLALLATTATVVVCLCLACTSFLLIELQTVLGGKAVELSEDDYALGAYMLYTSIVNIFLELAKIFRILDWMSDD